VTADLPGAAVGDDLESILRTLHNTGHLDAHSTIHPLTGGVSSIIALVDGPDGPWVVKAARGRLDVRDEWTADPRRSLREGAVLQRLDGHIGPLRTPKVRFIIDEPPILGLEWIAPPATNWKEQLLAGTVDLNAVEALASGLGALHRMPPPAGLDDGAGRLLFNALRIDPYYRAVAERRPEHAAALATLIDEQEQVHPARLVHGDVTPKNVLVGAGAPTLLDWEVVHAGDPAFDIGMLSAHLVLKACRDAAVGERSRLFDGVRLLWGRYNGPADPGLALRHCGAIVLARLWGKSTVDYLGRESGRAAAVAAACALTPGQSVDDMLATLAAELSLAPHPEKP
jgi:hypothetical protein